MGRRGTDNKQTQTPAQLRHGLSEGDGAGLGGQGASELL